MRRRLFLKALRDSLLALPIARVTAASARDPVCGKTRMEYRSQLKLFLAGDVMTGRGIDQILPHSSDPALHESYVKDARDYVSLAELRSGPIPKPVDCSYIWGDALDIWQAQAPDLRIVNLETSITTSDDYWPSKAIHYRMHPDNVRCLTAAGIDCCMLANNHVMDWSRDGLDETLATLHAAGLATAGAGRSMNDALSPARLSVSGKGDVLVFAFADSSSGVPGAWSAREDRGGVALLDDLSRRSADRVAEFIGAQRRTDDLVLLSIHWGGNWGYAVPKRQQRFARNLIDTGAVDIVHGHSSHHPKAIELYRGKVIIYGCGDFVTDYEGIRGREQYRPWLSPMYFVTVGLQSRRVERLEIVLMRLRRFQLIEASAGDRRWLRDRLNEHSSEFDTVVTLSQGTLVASPGAAGDSGDGDEYANERK